jgi:hypothetical protein
MRLEVSGRLEKDGWASAQIPLLKGLISCDLSLHATVHCFINYGRILKIFIKSSKDWFKNVIALFQYI